MNESQILNESGIPDSFDANQATDEELLIELCNEIKNDNGWKEVSGGFLKNYFENISASKLPLLRRYESYFEASGFKFLPGYAEKNFFLKAKFSDYQTRAYGLKGILFIYAQYKPKLESIMKSTAGELSKMLMPELKELEKKMQKINPQEKESKKPLEIILLKFPKQD
jgi:hypothetical protein